MGKELADSFQRLCSKMKYNSIVRRLAKPIKVRQIRQRHEEYLNSADSQYLKTLKGIHAGKRCFIIGNGPSLLATDLNKIIGEYSFASNRIYNIFENTSWRPTYYLATDPIFLKENSQKINEFEMGHKFIAAYRGDKVFGPLNQVTMVYGQGIEYTIKKTALWNDKRSYISEDISNHFCDGHTVTFYAIQLAIYMGFKEIFLMGIDNSYSIWLDEDGTVCHDDTVIDWFDNKKDVNRCISPQVSVNYSYQIAREYCDTHEITIRNATRGGKLEMFERVDFDSLFESSDK